MPWQIFPSSLPHKTRNLVSRIFLSTITISQCFPIPLNISHCCRYSRLISGFCSPKMLLICIYNQKNCMFTQSFFCFTFITAWILKHSETIYNTSIIWIIIIVWSYNNSVASYLAHFSSIWVGGTRTFWAQEIIQKKHTKFTKILNYIKSSYVKKCPDTSNSYITDA